MIDFEKLYVLWYSRVKAFALEYVLHEEDAENIVQDVFADLYEKRHLLKEGKNVTAYLFTSIKNKAFLFLKEKKKNRQYINELSDEQRLVSEMNLYVLAEMENEFESENALDQALDQAIQQLPEQCRTIFILNKFKHIKQKDIAVQLHLSINTVESQMALAYKKIKKEMQDLLSLALLFFLNLL